MAMLYPEDTVFHAFPMIELKDVWLRELTLADTEAFYSYMSDPKVHRFIAEEDTPHSLDAAAQELGYWRELFYYRRSVYWGIARKENNRLIGTCGFNLWSRQHKRAEISYDLSQRYWGKGIMTETIRAVCDYAFSVMQVRRIQATVAIENPASKRVLEKVGFKPEGLLREYGILRGKPHDFTMMSLLPNDMPF